MLAIDRLNIQLPEYLALYVLHDSCMCMRYYIYLLYHHQTYHTPILLAESESQIYVYTYGKKVGHISGETKIRKQIKFYKYTAISNIV